MTSRITWLLGAVLAVLSLAGCAEPGEVESRENAVLDQGDPATVYLALGDASSCTGSIIDPFLRAGQG